MHVDVLIGGQFGSEGKGVVAKALADRYKYHVRTGGPNAGHSFVDPHNPGYIYKAQVLPCGWVNREATLVIGRGAVLDLHQLRHELQEAWEVSGERLIDRLVIDERCGLLDTRHKKEEGGVEGTDHFRIGSTGKGVGAARRGRLRRKPDEFKLAMHCPDEELFGNVKLREVLANTVDILHDARGEGARVLLEGTQGFGLSLTHGPWPYVTTADITPSTMLAEVGLPPKVLKDTIMVLRTYPIRVAGPSGPLKGEISWDRLSAQVGRSLVERTTVTKKVRRIGTFDTVQVDEAVRVCAPTKMVVTFLDYIENSDHKVTNFEELSDRSKAFLDFITSYYNTPIIWGGTGFDRDHGWYKVEVP